MDRISEQEKEERSNAIEYLKSYRKLDENLHNTAPLDSVSYYATDKCLKYWDMAIEALAIPSVDPTDENLHREREQAYMQGYEDACKKYRQVQKTGHWILGICDNCGYDWGKDAPIASVPNFCPNCGTKMDYYYGNSPYSEERSEQNEK